METSEQLNEISEALNKAHEKIKNIPTNKTVDYMTKTTPPRQIKYSYADLASVIEATKDILQSNGISVLQSVAGECQTGISIFTRLQHKSGQWIQSWVKFPALKGGKMNDLQAMGATITYLRRYCLAPMLNIAVDEDLDGNIGDDGNKEPITEETINNHMENDNIPDFNTKYVDTITAFMDLNYIKKALSSSRTIEQKKKYLEDCFRKSNTAKKMNEKDIKEIIKEIFKVVK